MMAFKKILVIKFRSLGDTALMTAPLLELRRAYPRAKIHVAVTATWAPLLENNPAVDKIWPYTRREETAARAKAIARLALELRKEKFDCVVNFHASPSSSTLAFATGAKVRAIHFHGHKDKNRYSTVEVPGKGVVKPAIERDMDVIRALGIDVPEGKMPEIFLRNDELSGADQWLSAHYVKAPILGLGLGASRPTKIWPIERFSAVATRWIKETGGSVIALTGPGEAHLADEFQVWLNDALIHSDLDPKKVDEIKKHVYCPAPLDLRDAVALMSRMDLLLCNDSGLKHVAIARKTPTMTLIGPEHPFEWHPYPQDQYPYLFVDNLACRRDALPGMPPWCALEVCTVEKHKCMKQITVDQVMSELLRLKK